jgi:hypothetical protein
MKLPIVLLCGIAVMAVGIASWLTVQNRDLVYELQQTQIRLESASKRAQEVRRPVELAPRQMDQAAQLPEDQGHEFRRKLWEDADWRGRQFDDAYIRVEARYGRFIQKLVGWSPERVEKLKCLLANNELALMRAAMTGGNEAGGISPGDAIHEAESNNQQQLKRLLGDADYATFDASQKEEPYRDSVASIINAMRPMDAPVNEDTQEAILGAYAQAMQEAIRQTDPVDPQQLSKDQLAGIRKQQTDTFRVLLMNKLTGVMDETRLKAFIEAEIEQDGGH